MDIQPVSDLNPVTQDKPMVESAVLPIEVAVVGVTEPEEKPNNNGDCRIDEGGIFVGESDLSGKRKRGRPRKNPDKPEDEVMMPVPEYSSSGKRGRGRPKGTGKWQKLAASSCDYTQLGVGIVAGSNFTPYIINLVPGENITQKIWEFSQSTPDSLCILSASGVLSSAELREAGLRSVLRYQGWYDIVSLNGSHTCITDQVGQVGKNCQLSIQLLSSPEGRIFGGVVAGPLIVAQPTMLVLATFKEGTKVVSKKKARLDPAMTNDKVNGVETPLETEKLPEEGEEETNSLLAPVIPPVTVQTDEVIQTGLNTNNNTSLVSDGVPENINGKTEATQDNAANVTENSSNDVTPIPSHQEAHIVKDEELVNADWNSSVIESRSADENPNAGVEMAFNDQ